MGSTRVGLDDFAGEVIRPEDAAYDAARAVWNGMVDRRPALVVRPTQPEDVVIALRYAREQGLVVAVRCGGHSIPGHSTCDDGIVIDLSRMRGATVDPARRIAVCAGGALLADLDDAAQAVGLVCPVGVVSHTGVAGLTLGGGMGRLQRKFGLTIDNLRAVELVTADGRQVRASDRENGELFWGLRGAGANFGIATSFEFDLHPLATPLTHGTIAHSIEHADELAAHFRETLERAPDELWLGFYLSAHADGAAPTAAVSAQHCGTAAEAERDLATLRTFGAPLEDSIQPKSYLVAQHLADEPMEWGHRFYMKSAFLPTLPDELVALGVDHLHRVPADASADFSVWSCGGAMASVPEEAAAFTGRGAGVWLAVEALWDDPALDETCREWVRSAAATVVPYAMPGRYVNDVADEREDGRAIYGEAKYERLVALKREWDPDNVFRLNQNVRP
jgi:FAD/FMN-containing dehydrogenase